MISGWQCATPTLLMPTCWPLQEDITIKMRNILVDWLVDVHFKFKVRPRAIPVSLHPPHSCLIVLTLPPTHPADRS
jgi:hypothetical protein